MDGRTRFIIYSASVLVFLTACGLIINYSQTLYPNNAPTYLAKNVCANINLPIQGYADIINILIDLQDKTDNVLGLKAIHNTIKFLALRQNKKYVPKTTTTTYSKVTNDLPQRLWNTSVNWKEEFYPNANYSKGICGEIYVRPGDGWPTWPYFKLKETCSKQAIEETAESVTIVFNLVPYSRKEMHEATKAIEMISTLYNNIPILVAVPYGYNVSTIMQANVYTTKNDSVGSQWNFLIQKVITPYVFVARDILDFDNDVNMVRLVRELESLKLNVIGSAIKTITDGHWSHGCLQMTHIYYTLVFKLGYKHSKHDCLYCHSLQGPFIAKSQLLKSNPFDSKLPEDVLFYDYFYDLAHRKFLIGSCPDSMMNVRDKVLMPLNRTQWLPLVRKRSLNKLITNENTVFRYSCKESNINGPYKGLGFLRAPCQLQKLVDQIKFVMRTCKSHNIICHLNAGTTLGAVKFNGVLPWDIDGDIYYFSKNFSEVAKMEVAFRKAGYKLSRLFKPGKEGWGGGAYMSSGSGWNIDFYGVPWAVSKKPTVILFDGEWVETHGNPGKNVRDRYGPEAYKHVQHFRVLPKNQFSNERGYIVSSNFNKCPSPGSHDCLDQFEVDGNLQFNIT